MSRGQWQPARTDAVTDVYVRVAELVPLKAKLAAGVAGNFDKAHLEQHLLRRHYRDRIDDLGPELTRDGNGAVQCPRISHFARQHDTAIDGRGRDARAGKAPLELVGQARNVI